MSSFTWIIFGLAGYIICDMDQCRLCGIAIYASIIISLAFPQPLVHSYTIYCESCQLHLVILIA